MKRKMVFGLMVMVAAVLFMGCAAIKTPYAVHGDTHVGYQKVGEAYCETYLVLIQTGDCSIQAAMENGGISKIHHVDRKYENYLGFYIKETIIVYGE